MNTIFFVVSVIMIAIGDLMLIPAIVGMFDGLNDAQPFLTSSAIILAPALSLYFIFRRSSITIASRHAFFVTTVAWLVAAISGSLPIALHEHLSYTDAFFESMSGITTTGSTVLVGLDILSPALLLWRSILQWIGGLGFVLMSIAILPLLGVGGMRLYRSETSDWSEKSIPKIRYLAVQIVLFYILFSFLCAGCYWLFGMSIFDAINHAMTTVSTGGYSTSDLSMGKFDAPSILWTSTIFMFLASLPYVVYLQTIKTDLMTLIYDEQVRFFSLMILAVIGACTIVLINGSDYSIWSGVTMVAFNVVSIITTTGYSSTDYTLWGPFFVAVFLFLMFTGGCSGSTVGSIKAFRIQIAFKLLNVQIKRLIHPKGVFVAKQNGKNLDLNITWALVAFLFVVALTVIVLTITLAWTGLDLITALSSSVTAVTNVGPGLGEIVGPVGNFSTLPDSAKWLLAGGMLMGRLELMTVIVLFTPQYWR